MHSKRSSAINDLRTLFNDPAVIEDPYPVYRTLQGDDPACFLPLLDGAWLFFRYDDARALLSDPRLSSKRMDMPLRALPPDQRDQFGDMTQILTRWVAMKDRPIHGPLRRHLNQAFHALDRATLRERITPIVRSLVETIPADHEVDIIRDLGCILPSMVMTDLLGLPVADHQQLTAWADDLAFLFGSSVLTADDVHRAQHSTLALADYIRSAAEKGDLPQASLTFRLLHTETNGVSFTADEAYAQCIQFLFAGLEATRFGIGNALYALAHHPEQVMLLRRDPRHLQAAVEECLRFDPPVQWVGRVARASFEFQGCPIKAGQIVLPYVAAANRDPVVFSSPDTLDVTRCPPRPHLAFGAGPHYCPGAMLVREQVALTLQELLARFSGINLDHSANIEWNSNLGFHGHRSLKVRFTR